MFRIIGAVILLLQTCTIQAQERSHPDTGTVTPFTIGQSISFFSSGLQENRVLNIYPPNNYATDTNQRYPVIYVLDGSAQEDFLHICGIVQFLTMIGSMPPSLVVGISNIDRRRDFTFPTRIEKDKTDFPTTGGSDKFISCLSGEIIPLIERRFRTNNSRTIIGQSLGGLLAAEILSRQPGLFNTYFIVSPSLWWDNESILDRFNYLAQYKGPDSIHIFLSVGSEGKAMQSATARLAETIKKARLNKLRLQFQPLPQEDHLTILHNAIYAALLWRYKKYINHP